MKNNLDTLQRFVFENSAVRGNLVNLTQTLNLALNQQQLPKGLRKALGELMAASALLAATLKMNGALVMQIQSTGTLKLLVVECTTITGEALKMRATAKWSEDITDEQDLFELVEHAQFMITLDPKESGQAYQGIVPLEGSSISAALENYMLRSEQIDTRIFLSCDGDSAAGMLIQKLPETMNQLTLDRDEDTWARVGHLASTITDDELLHLPTETLLTRLFHQEDVRLFEPTVTEFFCSCSRDSVSNMLRMLGDEEILGILEERGNIEVNCDFCNALYTFDKVDAAQLLVSEAAVVTPSAKIH
ncbi:MAG: Hsp33 family molecular chaperone HslO [Methylophilales bacterium]|nr:Hsp33 family molecular chaperone HslO [Methylophilales bacterium]